jgi:mannose-1-phosphate guanylyltransferase
MRKGSLDEFWSVVLAAGEGSRLLPLTRRLHGENRPKQFAVLKGDRSLLQDTMHRLAPLVRPEHAVVVVADQHVDLAEEQLATFRGADVVGQPRNVGTGPGVLLPLARVLARWPEANVVVTPSDHHFRHPERFLTRLTAAAVAARSAPAGACLVGVEAEGPATDLGWIVPGAPLDVDVEATLVDHFEEKPTAVRAAALHRAGALWNTFVIVGPAWRLWRLAARHLPRQTALFDRYLEVVDGPREAAVLEEIYAALEPADFSRDVLQRAEGLATVPLRDAGWSDWGTPERLIESLEGTAELAQLRQRLDQAPGTRFEASPVRAVV